MQGTGPVGVPADPVVLAPLGDLFAVLEPVNLGHETSSGSTGVLKTDEENSSSVRGGAASLLTTTPEQPSYLGFGVSVDLAGEGHRHALEDFVVLQLLIEGWRHPLSGRVLVVLHVVVRLLHRRALQAELDLTDEPLLEAGNFVFLRGQRDRRTEAQAEERPGTFGWV